MTDCDSILEMNKKCLDFLLEKQSMDNNFYFVPRKINKLNRLKQGYYFIGNEVYMQISFWNGADSHERIHNISWGTFKNGSCYIEISSRDNAKKAKSLNKLVRILEKETGKKYTEQYSGKWFYNYNKDEFYLDTLQSFIELEKPLIDNYLKNNTINGIALLDEDFNEKYIKKLIYSDMKLTTKKIKLDKKKQEGTKSVCPSSYIMAFNHNKLQNELLQMLKEDNNNIVVDSEVNNVDISVKKKNGEKIFYELKTSDAKEAIRCALGQLLEYCHYSNKSKADKLIIVTEYTPDKQDIEYLKTLRSLYKLPIFYQQFNMKIKKLSKCY